MQESLEPSHNLPGDAQHLRVSILVRALVRGWRHTGRLRVGVDIIEALDLVAEASRRSSSITPEALAQPGHRERVGGSRELAQLCGAKAQAVAAGWSRLDAQTTGRWGRLFRHWVRPLAATTRGGVVPRSISGDLPGTVHRGSAAAVNVLYCTVPGVVL